jgi:hypothetical protein
LALHDPTPLDSLICMCKRVLRDSDVWEDRMEGMRLGLD